MKTAIASTSNNQPTSTSNNQTIEDDDDVEEIGTIARTAR